MLLLNITSVMPCTPGALLTLRALSTLTPTSCPPAPRPRCGTTDPRARPQLYSSWHSLSRVWTERNGRLEEQLQAALSYQDTMQVGAGALRQIPHGWGCVTFPSPLRGARGRGAPQPHPPVFPIPSGCWSGWTQPSCASPRSSWSAGTWTWCSSSWRSSRCHDVPHQTMLCHAMP